MQLKENQLLSKANITRQLTLATASLLANSATAKADENDEDEWGFAGSVLVYSEPDRVSAVEALFNAKQIIDDTASITYKVVLDSLTGASANGAIEQNEIQTFTRPSGNGQYTIQAQTTPLDDTFKDTRVQININWSDAIGENSNYSFGTNLSREYDYQSITINGDISRDFNQKNTTLLLGLSLANDTVEPVGGRPLAFSTMVVNEGQFVDEDTFRQAFDLSRIDGDGSIDTGELLLGWTQIVNRRMLMQFNYGYADVSGYLTDPYKVLSVVDQNADTQDLRYEKRPGSKIQHSLFGLVKYHFEESVLDLSYRYTTTDWEIDSHTIDFKWHIFAKNDSFWEPHIRYYSQSAAEFYKPYLISGEALPEFASADYRLSEMSAITLGLKYGFTLSGGEQAEIRAEYYLQTPGAARPETVSAAESFDLYPEVDAFTMQFSYFW